MKTRAARRPIAARAPARAAGTPRLAASGPVRQLLWSRPATTPAPLQVQRTLDDPARFDTVHQSLFVNAPGGGARQPWVSGTTDVQIISAFKQHVQQELETNPMRVVGSVSTPTTQSGAEAVAVQADTDLHVRFPQIPTQLTPAQVRGRVTVFAPDFAPANAPSADFLANWIDNQLPMRTNIETFAIASTDPDYRAVVNALATDSTIFPIAGVLAEVANIAANQGQSPSDVALTVATVRAQIQNRSWSWIFNRMASRTAAFHGQGRVFISQGMPAARLRATLIHELIHSYANADYTRWVEATTSPRMFNEGFTELLTRAALTPAELSGRTSYQDAINVLNADVTPHIPLDDIARAFFLGEVWRVEGASTVSKEMFERQVGIAANATRTQEVTASQTGPGIFQTVIPGERFRLLNFGNDQSTLKAEHETFMRTVILPLVQGDATARLRFVGHADDTGAATRNATLARQRSAAVYQFARAIGIPASQLLDANAPPSSGSTDPTASNANVHGRAFNRRVEIFVTH